MDRVGTRLCSGAPLSGGRSARILQIGKYYPPDRGGIESHLQVLCHGLSAFADVRVLVSSLRAPPGTFFDGPVQVVRNATHLHLAGAPLDPGLPLQIRRAGADLIHLHWPNPQAVVALLASRCHAPLVLTYHSDVVRQRRLGRLFRPLLQRALARSDAIIVSSRRYLDSSRELQRWRARCHVVPFGVPPPAAADSTAPPALPQPWVLAVGRLVHYKGFAVLIDSMGYHPAHVVIVGDGPLRGALLQQAQRLGVADRLHLFAQVTDLTAWYRGASLFVLPSIERSEAFGIVQLEAMSHGLPVINTELDSGVPEVSRHGETGLTVPPGDPVALGGAIAALLADSATRQRFGEAARRRWQTHFTVRRMVDQIVDVYRIVLDSGPSRRIADGGR